MKKKIPYLTEEEYEELIEEGVIKEKGVKEKRARKEKLPPPIKHESLIFKKSGGKENLNDYLNRYMGEDESVDYSKIDQYRELRLRSVLKELTRKYKYVNSNKFIYNDRSDLLRKHRKMDVYFLAYDQSIGYTVLTIPHYIRGKGKTPNEWLDYFKGKRHKKILFNKKNGVIETLNVMKGREYFIHDIIAWGSPDDIRRNKISKIPSSGVIHAKKTRK